MSKKQQVRKTKKKTAVVPSEIDRKANLGSRFVDGFKTELSKVTWPTGDKVFKASVVILIIVVFSTLFVAGIDVILSKLMIELKSRFG